MNAATATRKHPAKASLEVYLLGMVDFESSLDLQERLVYEISGRDDSQGILLVCEHPPVLTVGREGSRAHIRCEPAQLASRQLDVRWVNRGGGCLVHAPGQLAVYPILPLQRLGFGLAAYREALETAVLDVCAELLVPAFRHEHAAGVFSRSGQFAHLGVAVKSWVSYHGLFVDVCPAMDWIRMVDSTGRGERQTSLAAERVRPTAMHSVRESLIRNLAERCGYGRFHLYTGHPLLRRTRRVVAYA